MALKIGNNAVANAFVGTSQVRRAYKGSSLVYQGFSPASEQEFIEQTAAGGPAQLLKVYGKSIVNNQLGKVRNSAAEVYGITRTKVDELTIHYSGTSSRTTTFTGTENIYFTQGHKYYCAVNAVPTGCTIAGVVTFAAKSTILSYTAANAYNNLGLYVPSGVQVDDDVQFYVIDLTLLYGAGHEPISVAQFEADYPEYDPTYDPGSLQSNKTAELRAYDGGTLRGSLALNLSTLTSGGVAVFPDGMRGVGSIRDEAEGSTGVVRLGKRAYQAGDESDTSVLTDGTNTIYPLATPLTYTLDTPLPTDLTCVQGDILQRVSDNNCPFVGEMKFGL